MKNSTTAKISLVMWIITLISSVIFAVRIIIGNLPFDLLHASMLCLFLTVSCGNFLIYSIYSAKAKKENDNNNK